MGYDGADRFADATPLYAQGLAQSPEAWYAWGGKIGHELALGHVEQAVFAYRRWLHGVAGDTTLHTEAGWAAVREVIPAAGPQHPRKVFALQS